MTTTSTEPDERPCKLPAALQGKLHALRRGLVASEVVRRIAMALAVSLAGLAVIMLADWWFDFSLEMRTRLLVGLGAVLLVLLLHAVVALITRREDVESLALLVERADPTLKSRLIATVQFAEGKASVPDAAARTMVRKLSAETEEQTRDRSFTDFVDTRAMQRALLWFSLIGGVMVAGFFAGGSIAKDLVRRAFLADIPVPRATRVVWVSGDLKIGAGDSVVLEGRVDGEAPANGRLKVRFDSGRKTSLPMPYDGRHYQAELENLQESFEYRVEVNDGRSELHTVLVVPRPEVLELAGRQTYPDYTGLEPTEHKPGEFLLFPGSSLELRIKASRPLRAGRLRMLGRKDVIHGQVDDDNPFVLNVRFETPEEGLTGFMVELLDSGEMTSRDSTVYRVDLLRDESPEIQIVKPTRRRELVTSAARILVGYVATDRFGVASVRLRYRRGGEPSGPVRDVSVALPEEGAPRIEDQLEWDLATLDPPLEIGEEVAYWLEAEDQNASTGPGISEQRVLKVVTAREKRDDLLTRAGDYLGRVDKTTDDQEQLNAVLADWIRNQAGADRPEPSKQEQE